MKSSMLFLSVLTFVLAALVSAVPHPSSTAIALADPAQNLGKLSLVSEYASHLTQVV
jgi:hypothetical protein